MFKKNINKINVESTEDFLARGGQVTKVAKTASYKRKTTKKKSINAQALYNAAVGTSKEAEVIAFLKSQGIKVE